MLKFSKVLKKNKMLRKNVSKMVANPGNPGNLEILEILESLEIEPFSC